MEDIGGAGDGLLAIGAGCDTTGRAASMTDAAAGDRAIGLFDADDDEDCFLGPDGRRTGGVRPGGEIGMALLVPFVSTSLMEIADPRRAIASSTSGSSTKIARSTSAGVFVSDTRSSAGDGEGCCLYVGVAPRAGLGSLDTKPLFTLDPPNRARRALTDGAAVGSSGGELGWEDGPGSAGP